MSAFSFNTTYQPTGDQQKDAIAQIGSCRIVLFRQILHIRAAGILVHSLRCSTSQ